MCCEATDALLEYVRRYLGMTGLRNLNAPRRLKLRVPVLKEWLQRQGQSTLAHSIPDWDPVRRPTGRWKSWEMAHLKPIMDEKAVERQAKRNLVSGEANKMAAIREQQAEDNRLDAVDALMTVAGGGNPPTRSGRRGGGSAAPVPLLTAVPAGEDYEALIVDDAGEGGCDPEGEGEEEDEVGEVDDDGVGSAGEVMEQAHVQLKELRELLMRIQPPEGECASNAALFNCIQAIDTVGCRLNESMAVVARECVLRPVATTDASQAEREAAFALAPPGAPAAPIWPALGAVKKEEDDAPVGEINPSQEDAVLLMGASQVSLSGLSCSASQAEAAVNAVASSQSDSQPASQLEPPPVDHDSDGTSPREGVRPAEAPVDEPVAKRPRPSLPQATAAEALCSSQERVSAMDLLNEMSPSRPMPSRPMVQA